MQKTVTVNGKCFTSQRIAKMFDDQIMTDGDEYIIHLNGKTFFGQYRKVQDSIYAPVCNRSCANVIALTPQSNVGTRIWLKL